VIDVLLPSLGADMGRAKLNQWLVAPGDAVRRGQVIAEIETEKAVLDVECWDDGVIEELCVEPGPDWHPVGTVLARIRPVEEPAIPVPTAGPSPTPAGPTPPRPRTKEVSPPIRHLAADLEVDLSEVTGSGPGGSITRDDIRRVAGSRREPEATGRAKASPRARHLAKESGVDLETVSPGSVGWITAAEVESASSGAVDRSTTMRQAIARAMARSKREIPHYYLGTHIDLDRALNWLTARNEERPVTEWLLPAALLLKATSLALREVPDLNGYWVEDSFHPTDHVHLGVAISIREGGLVAPAIHDADLLTPDETMSRLRDLVTRARTGRLRTSEMSEGTVTVTNLGDRGVETAFPVIIPPQVAIVGFGKVMEAAVVVDGSVVAHPVVNATLAADHRVTDGHRGGQFLTALDRVLQDPESL
jgi:pyruvate dehydrogenase E2 component (dihydrolipoamide acetyltransferase)